MNHKQILNVHFFIVFIAVGVTAFEKRLKYSKNHYVKSVST